MIDKHKDTDSEELLDSDELILDSDEDYYSSDRPYADEEDKPEDDEPAEIDQPEIDKYEDEDDASEEDDFYNDDDYSDTPKPVKIKQQRLDPEDPDYWLDEQSEFDHIIPKPRKVWKWWLAGCIALVVALVGVWIWFFRPYVDGAVKYGYIKSMERRGTLVKTFEGVLIPYRELGDKTPTYFEEIEFSVEGDSLAANMKQMMLDGIPVRLEYEKYHRPLFWIGQSPMVIVAADTADAKRILPPEYR